METFERELARLNEQQRLAVETIEGPVLCVAGPGSGKTQVVALRVANILQRTQMRPGNILCLTFSISGATAMRERLRALIGADAYGVQVNTIHGFCNDIIAQNPHIFEAWSALEQISDVERYRVLNTIIDRMMPDIEIINKKSPYGRTKDIIDKISTVKREGKSLSDLRAVAVEYRQQLESKSKPGTKAHEKDVLTARKFDDFVSIFEQYQENLKQTQRYDYDDMILSTLKGLEEEEWLLAGLQEKYQYVLIDEFQDTNGAQYTVLDRLTRPLIVDHAPNVFVVGDDDQAIYRFQGANLQNILRFREAYPQAPIIVLGTSYRSTQAILDAASSLISHNEERLVRVIPGLSKDLVAASGEQGNPPTLLFSASDVTEPWTVAEVIEEKIASGLPSEEIAILTQTNAELFRYYDVLRAKGIPVQLEGKLDLLGHPLVKQAIALLKCINGIEINSALAEAISCDCIGCHPADVGQLFLTARERGIPLLHLLLELDVTGSPSEGLFLRDRERLLRARDTLLRLSRQREQRTIVETLVCVLEECGLLKADPVPDPVDFAALQAFFERIKYRTYEQAHFDFTSLLRDLELYTHPDFSGLRMTYAAPHILDTGVRLMTAHQSKGLEFDVVILGNFREGQWDKRRNPPSLAFPDDLLFGWERDQKAFEQHQDERRVAYVAMTRARKELIFSCPRELTTGDKSRAVSPSAFFAEAGRLPEQDRPLRDAAAVSTLLLRPVRAIDAEFASFLRNRLGRYALSVTALNRFLEDPRMFLELDLLQTPQIPGIAMVYGNAVHAALRKWAMAHQQGMPIDADQLLAEFSNYLVEREVTTEKERLTLLALGEENLPRYFRQRLAGSTPFVHKIEYPLHAHLEDIPLKGMIDRIDLDHPDSALATVIDYKTGKPRTESEIRQGDYYRQLTFYALLLELGRGDLKPKSFVLDFIGEGSEHPIVRSFEISEQDKQELRQVIRAVWAKITALDFTPL